MMKVKLKYLILILAIIFRYFQFYNLVSNNSLLCYLFVFAIVLLSLFEIFYIKFNRKLFTTFISILFVSFVIFLSNTDDNLFIYSLIALFFIDTDNKDMIKCFFITSLCMYIFTIVLNQFGIIASNDALRSSDLNSTVRYSLGFGHVNSVFLYYLPIAYSFYYLFSDKKYTKIIILLSTIVLFLLSNCRTGFVFSILFILVSFINPEKISMFLRKYSKYLFFTLTIVSIVCAVIFGTTKSNIFNQLLSGRLYNAFYYIEKGYMFSLFGSGVKLTLPLDNFYINLLVTRGIIIYFFYLFLYQKGTSLVKDYKLIIIICFFLLYGMSEASTVCNFALIILIKEIFLDARKSENYG